MASRTFTYYEDGNIREVFDSPAPPPQPPPQPVYYEQYSFFGQLDRNLYALANSWLVRWIRRIYLTYFLVVCVGVGFVLVAELVTGGRFGDTETERQCREAGLDGIVVDGYNIC